VAILTLRRVGMDPASLLTGIEKIAKFNAVSTGPAWNAFRYPSAEERRRFARAILTWADSHPQAAGSTSLQRKLRGTEQFKRSITMRKGYPLLAAKCMCQAGLLSAMLLVF
jgi:hypothetical protein